MSDKYILRSGAIDAIKRNSGTLYTREAEFLLQKVIFLLKNAPAADVVEVRHGRWIGSEMNFGYCDIIQKEYIAKKYICSECGYETGDQAKKFVCCPICMARMDKEDEHEAD